MFAEPILKLVWVAGFEPAPSSPQTKWTSYYPNPSLFFHWVIYSITTSSIKFLHLLCQYWWCVGHIGIRFDGSLFFLLWSKWCTTTILSSPHTTHFFSWCAKQVVWYLSCFQLPWFSPVLNSLFEQLCEQVPLVFLKFFIGFPHTKQSFLFSGLRWHTGSCLFTLWGNISFSQCMHLIFVFVSNISYLSNTAEFEPISN